MEYRSKYHGENSTLDVLLAIEYHVNILFVNLIEIDQRHVAILTLHPHIAILQKTGVPFLNSLFLSVTNYCIYFVNILLLTLHLDLLDGQLPFHLDLVVQLEFRVLEYLEPVEMNLNQFNITTRMLGHSLKYLVCYPMFLPHLSQSIYTFLLVWMQSWKQSSMVLIWFLIFVVTFL